MAKHITVVPSADRQPEEMLRAAGGFVHLNEPFNPKRPPGQSPGILNATVAVGYIYVAEHNADAFRPALHDTFRFRYRHMAEVRKNHTWFDLAKMGKYSSAFAMGALRRKRAKKTLARSAGEGGRASARPGEGHSAAVTLGTRRRKRLASLPSSGSPPFGRGGGRRGGRVAAASALASEMASQASAQFARLAGESRFFASCVSSCVAPSPVAVTRIR